MTNTSGAGTTNGFQLRQSTTPTGRAEFVVGEKYYPYKDYVLSLAPTGYWRFDETSGTTAKDLSANAYNGTYTGGVTLNQSGALTGSGDSDASVLFNGSSGYVSTAVGSDFIATANQAITITAWIKPTTIVAGACSGTASNRIISLPGGGGSTIAVMTASSNQLCYYNDSTGTFTAWSGTIPLNAWSFVSLVYSGTCFQKYLNGVADGSCLTATLTSGSSTVTKIGTFDGTSFFFKGNIDEVAIFNHALSSTQISNLYNAGTITFGVPYPGNVLLADNPVAYWRLGEKSGKVAYDYSGNSNSGNYVGGLTLGHAGAVGGEW